ncbi:MAG: hypothetical protein IKF38_00750 [Clostridia bacterium]|nr:hypothetical protein [Clostridia bacterium]
MKNNKSKKVFIFAIIVIVLILIVGTVYALVATNMFKSNKDLFFKYAAQFFDNEKGFIDAKIVQYNDKKQNSAFEHQGVISTNENNETISFAGNVDNPNAKIEELINLNYSSSVNFPIMYKKVKTSHALKFSDISKRYFGIDESEIGKLLSGNNSQDSVVNKAQEAKIKDLIAAAKDTIAIKVSEIQIQNYQNKIDNSSTEESLGEKILAEKYEAKDVDISTESNENGDNIGSITIKYEQNPNCYVVGNVSKDGKIKWEDIVVEITSQNTDTTTTPGLPDFSNIALTQAEKEKLQNTYFTAIKDNLDNSSFTKVTTTEGEGYSLEISNEKIKEILIKLLETLKDDELMLEKLKNISGTLITSKNIEQGIENLNAQEVEEGNSTITVYQSKDKLNKIQIQYNDEFKITMEKTSSDNDVTYTIDFENQSSSINLKASYSGLQALEEVTENYEISINASETYTFKIENTVNFTNTDINISNFETNEYIDFASLSQEKAGKLYEAIVKAIIETNTEKAEQAGVKENNSFATAIQSINAGYNIQNQAMKAIESSSDNMQKQIEEMKKMKEEAETSLEKKQTTTETEKNTQSEANTNTTNTETSTTTENNNTNTEEQETKSSTLVDGMEKVTKESFNEKFKQYEGSNVKGQTVKSLIMQVIANNMIDDGRKIEVTGDIALTGTEVPDSINSSKYYVVKCSTDSDGYVNKVDIKVK